MFPGLRPESPQSGRSGVQLIKFDTAVKSIAAKQLAGGVQKRKKILSRQLVRPLHATDVEAVVEVRRKGTLFGRRNRDRN